MRKIIILFLISSISMLFAQSVNDIVKKMDENQTFKTFKADGKVIIEGKYGKRTSEYSVFAKGTENTLIEFLSGEEEGQKIFKTTDDLYIKYPFAEEIQRLSRKKTLGAVSYDEMSGEKNTLKDYDAILLSEEQLDGVDVYKIELTAKTSKVAHYKKEVFIKKDNFVVLKTLYYSKSGKLTKEALVLEVKTIGGKTVPVRSIVSDKLKKNSSTENIITNMEIDGNISDDIFSLDELAW